LFWLGQEHHIAKGAKTQIPFLEEKLTKCFQDLFYGIIKPGSELVTALLPHVCLLGVRIPVLYKLESLNQAGGKMQIFWHLGEGVFTRQMISAMEEAG